MSIISKVAEISQGEVVNVDLSSNTLQVQDLQVGSVPLSQAQAAASFSGTLSGTSTAVSILANVPGSNGNFVALVFNGSNTIAAAIATWNLANPSNQVTLTSGDGTQIPLSQTLNLTGGLDPGSSTIGNASTYVNFTPTAPTVAGALAGIDAALVAVSGSQKVDKFTLNSTDISNKFVTLSSTPSTAGNTILLVEDAGNMFYGVDFTVSGNQLSWSSLALDGILSSGDNLTITYKA